MKDSGRAIIEDAFKSEGKITHLHVYPNEITLCSLSDIRKTYTGQKGEQKKVFTLCRYNTETLNQMRKNGLRSIEVRQDNGNIIIHSDMCQNIAVQCPGSEKVRTFLDWVKNTRTGLYLELTGRGNREAKRYRVTSNALRLMMEQLCINASPYRSCIQDMALAERLVAMQPERRIEYGAADRLRDRINATGYTVTTTQEGNPESYFDGNITAIHSGGYTGAGTEQIKQLCLYILDEKTGLSEGNDIYCTGYSERGSDLAVGFEIGTFMLRAGEKECTISKGIVLTDSSENSAFTIWGVLTDRETGDRIIVSERKRRHRGKFNIFTAVKEKWIHEIIKEMEEFVRLVRMSENNPTGASLYNFKEKLYTEEMLSCAGQKRVAAVINDSEGELDTIFSLLHLKSTVAKLGMKSIAKSRQVRLQRAIADAIREAVVG